MTGCGSSVTPAQINDLPDNVLCSLLEHADFEALGRLACTSHRFCELCSAVLSSPAFLRAQIHLLVSHAIDGSCTILRVGTSTLGKAKSSNQAPNDADEDQILQKLLLGPQNLITGVEGMQHHPVLDPRVRMARHGKPNEYGGQDKFSFCSALRLHGLQPEQLAEILVGFESNEWMNESFCSEFPGDAWGLNRRLLIWHRSEGSAELIFDLDFSEKASHYESRFAEVNPETAFAVHKEQMNKLKRSIGLPNQDDAGDVDLALIRLWLAIALTSTPAVRNPDGAVTAEQPYNRQRTGSAVIGALHSLVQALDTLNRPCRIVEPKKQSKLEEICTQFGLGGECLNGAPGQAPLQWVKETWGKGNFAQARVMATQDFVVASEAYFAQCN